MAEKVAQLLIHAVLVLHVSRADRVLRMVHDADGLNGGLDGRGVRWPFVGGLLKSRGLKVRVIHLYGRLVVGMWPHPGGHILTHEGCRRSLRAVFKPHTSNEWTERTTARRGADDAIRWPDSNDGWRTVSTHLRREAVALGRCLWVSLRCVTLTPDLTVRRASSEICSRFSCTARVCDDCLLCFGGAVA